MSMNFRKCKECGLHYILTEHSTPEKCNICNYGIKIDYRKPLWREDLH